MTEGKAEKVHTLVMFGTLPRAAMAGLELLGLVTTVTKATRLRLPKSALEFVFRVIA